MVHVRIGILFFQHSLYISKITYRLVHFVIYYDFLFRLHKLIRKILLRGKMYNYVDDTRVTKQEQPPTII